MFNTQDVLTVAKAVVDTAIDYERDNCGPWQSERDFKKCIYCYKNVQLFGDGPYPDIVHKLDCPYLIAQDLLTKTK